MHERCKFGVTLRVPRICSIIIKWKPDIRMDEHLTKPSEPARFVNVLKDVSGGEKAKPNRLLISGVEGCAQSKARRIPLDRQNQKKSTLTNIQNQKT